MSRTSKFTFDVIIRGQNVDLVPFRAFQWDGYHDFVLSFMPTVISHRKWHFEKNYFTLGNPA